MRTLINYIRQCFCKHEWDTEAIKTSRAWVKGWEIVDDIKVIKTCKKCDYIKSYWKLY